MPFVPDKPASGRFVPDAPVPVQVAPPAPRPRNLTEELKRQLGLTARAGAEAVGALPLVAADAGVAVRNLATGSDYEAPSAMYSRGLDQIFPTRETTLEKGVGLAAGMVAGSRLPIPQVKAPAPAGYAPAVANAIRSQTLKTGREAGYVVPPATARPNVGNVILESLGGKAQTQQVAALRNQNVTDDLARKALGIPKGTPLEPKMLESLRGVAGGAYEAVKNSGTIRADSRYVDDLVSLTKEADVVSAGFPDLKVGNAAAIKELQEGLFQTEFDASAAVELGKQLRHQATALFRSDKPESIALARASRSAASIVEDLVIRNLRAAGKGNLADDFEKARVLIAKTHSVEAALNPGTGHVVANKISAELGRGRPLSGELLTIAKMQKAFSPVMGEVLSSPGVSVLDMAIGGIGGAALNPAMLAWPAARYGMRQGLLSKPYQGMFAQPKGAASGLFGQRTASPAATGLGLLNLYEEDRL